MVHRATYSVRFRCLEEHAPLDFDEEEDEDIPQTRYRHGEQFSALMRCMVGPPLDNKRHVTLSMLLVPNIENETLSRGIAGMTIEENSNIVIERGVISTFCTNAITVPCCTRASCGRRALLFPSLTVFVEWPPHTDAVEYMIEPSIPISSLHVSFMNPTTYNGTYTSITSRANEIVPGYFPDAPVETSAKARVGSDDAARRARIKARQKELAEQRHSRKAARKCSADDDESEAEAAEVDAALARSRLDVGGGATGAGAAALGEEAL